MKIDLSFQAISQAIQRLELPDFDLVVGVGRGGVVPASLLAYKLDANLTVIDINYRDDDNQPRHDAPVLLRPPAIPDGVRTVLLVDDVSVTGKTLETAKHLFDGYAVTTLVLKGRADFVLFPNISSCVNWPWKAESASRGKDETGSRRVIA